MTSDQKQIQTGSGKPRSRKLYVLWAIALTLLLVVGAAVYYVIVPVLKARSLIQAVSFQGVLFRKPPREYSRSAILQACSTVDQARHGIEMLYRLGQIEGDQLGSAAYILGASGQGGEALLIKLSRSQDPKVRLVAGSSLIQIGSRRGIALLRELSSHNDPMIREFAIRRLTLVRDPFQADIFCKSLAGSDQPTRDAALETMKRILGDELRYLLGAYCRPLYHEEDAELSSSSLDIDVRKRLEDPRALSIVAYMLRDLSLRPHWRSMAAFRLGSAPKAKVETLLLETIRSEKEPTVQAQIAFAIGVLDIRKGEVPVTNLLQSSNSEVRFYAVQALGLIGGKKAHAALRGLRKDPDPKVQKAVVSAIAEIESRLGPRKLKLEDLQRFEGSTGGGEKKKSKQPAEAPAK